jgi:hypothetical protein
MKKILSVFVAIAFAFVIPAISFAYFTEANIIEELQSKIAYLLEQVESLKKQLAEKQSGSVVEFCYNFDSNLQIGSSNSNDVSSLLTALVKEGVATERGSNFSGTFDETMASYVTAFQEKYRNEILTPNGLKNGTGYLGRSTRAKLNALYGCKKPTPSVCTIENPCTNMPVVQIPSTSTSNCPLSVDSNGNISHVCSTNNDLIKENVTLDKWKVFVNKEDSYSFKYPNKLTYFDTNLINYDSGGVKIQIQKRDITENDFEKEISKINESIKSGKLNTDEGTSQTEIKSINMGIFTYYNKVLSGPGGSFVVYYSPLKYQKKYLAVLVWGEENDYNTVKTILSSFTQSSAVGQKCGGSIRSELGPCPNGYSCELTNEYSGYCVLSK